MYLITSDIVDSEHPIIKAKDFSISWENSNLIQDKKIMFIDFFLELSNGQRKSTEYTFLNQKVNLFLQFINMKELMNQDEKSKNDIPKSEALSSVKDRLRMFNSKPQ